jgi:hypothetical protein
MEQPAIVIGAGVAGCVAARTLADAGHEVLVLEAGPGPERPRALDGLDHLQSVAVTDWWFTDLPRRGTGSGGSSAVNGMVLDGVEPLDARRWGWDDAAEHQAWVLARWPTIELDPGPFTAAIGELVCRGFPVANPTRVSGWLGWAPLSVAAVGQRRVSAADAFLDDRIEVRYRTAVQTIGVASGSSAPFGASWIETKDGRRFEGSHVFVAAGAVGSPELLVASGLIERSKVLPLMNHPSTAVIAELDPSLQSAGGPPSSRMLRTVSGLSENTVDLQMLVLDHTGDNEDGRRHGAVIVTALEPDRQKVLIAGITQALRWLGELEGVRKISLSPDPSPVQHHACSLAGLGSVTSEVSVIDGSVLPALPHTNPMVSVAVGARRATLAAIGHTP